MMVKEFPIRTGFDANPLTRMVAVGDVGPRHARIWMRSEKPGEVEVTVCPEGELRGVDHLVNIENEDADWTQTILVRGLDPLTRYRYAVRRTADYASIGYGRFQTFPESPDQTPKKVSVALMSCHQPFNESNFEIEPRNMRLLKLTKQILADHDVKFILLAGDQIYADVPEQRSLIRAHYTEKWEVPEGPTIFHWTPETIRKAYQERYRIFWKMNEVKHFYANYPCYPILDDHEIMDDWGARKDHAGNLFQKIKRGAREAYFDYQGSRMMDRKKNLPPSFHYSFAYGNVGVFVLDLRSQRKAGDKGQLFLQSQMKDFEKFLNTNQDKRVLLIMVSVPVVHLPRWLVEAGAAIFSHEVDFPDHWSHHSIKHDRDQFLRLIYQHQVNNPSQRVILVSGDVHIGCVFEIEWQGKGNQPVLYQFTSSAISNRMQKLKAQISAWAPKRPGAIHCKNGPKAETKLLKSVNQGQNPFGGLNIGIIEIENGPEESAVTLKLVGYPDGDYDQYKDFFVSQKL